MMFNILSAINSMVPQSLHLFLSCCFGEQCRMLKSPSAEHHRLPRAVSQRLTSPYKVLLASSTAANLITSQGTSRCSVLSDRQGEFTTSHAVDSASIIRTPNNPTTTTKSCHLQFAPVSTVLKTSPGLQQSRAGRNHFNTGSWIGFELKSSAESENLQSAPCSFWLSHSCLPPCTLVKVTFSASCDYTDWSVQFARL